MKHVPVGTTPSHLDRAIEWARFQSSRAIAMTVVMACGYGFDLESFREHKLKRVAEGKCRLIMMSTCIYLYNIYTILYDGISFRQRHAASYSKQPPQAGGIPDTILRGGLIPSRGGVLPPGEY